MQSPDVEFVVDSYGESLSFTRGTDAARLGVTSPLRVDLESETHQDGDDFLP